jgi:nucleotide-binding universal stress UspA family protein
VTRTPAEAERLRQLSSEGGVRIHEDPEPEPEPEIDRHDSDDDADDDGDGSQRGRGRKRPEPGRTTSGKSTNLRADSEESEPDSHSAAPSKPDPTKGESKLMFEKDVPSRSAAANYARRRLVQPSTAFDAAPSAYSTPLHSDDETHNELIAAQKLSLTMSQIHSTPSAHRVIRQIIRGDFEYFQKQAETGHQRQRMYLVATDISPEAEYALEWTIGTVLRDGDTLFAVYAADEESVGAGEVGLQVGHGADSVRDIADVVKFLQLSPQAPASPGPSPLAKENAEKADASHNIPPSAENERRRALEEISSRCIRLLRKTRLQVRVVVEVFHCKSPRHMITEVIDFLTPTLVIIGSRGQSAMKGVLLGSFSNYLVTKSSVPVMVARKKLKKHSKASASSVHKDGLAMPYRGSGRSGRFSNIIEVPRTAGLRVNSWDEVGID